MIIGARTAAWAQSGGGVPTARDYVQDGLVAMWDGIENAGWGVHYYSDTVWQDLMRPAGTGIPIDSTMRFTNNGLSVTVDKGVIFGGATQTSFYLQNFPLDTSSFECVFTADEYSPNADIANGIFGIEIGDRRRFVYGMPWGVKYYSWPEGMGFSYYAYNSSSIFNTPGSHYVAWSQNDESKDRMYIDAELVKSVDTKTSSLSFSHRMNFNRVFNGVGGIGGVYHCLRIYSRALSAAEIAANYAVDKARFNLP